MKTWIDRLGRLSITAETDLERSFLTFLSMWDCKLSFSPIEDDFGSRDDKNNRIFN